MIQLPDDLIETFRTRWDRKEASVWELVDLLTEILTETSPLVEDSEVCGILSNACRGTKSELQSYARVGRYWPPDRRGEFPNLSFDHLRIIGDDERMAEWASETNATSARIREKIANDRHGVPGWLFHLRKVRGYVYKALGSPELSESRRKVVEGILTTINELETEEREE